MESPPKHELDNYLRIRENPSNQKNTQLCLGPANSL